LHNNGIFHRDLKLSNLFLSQEMNIKIGDFGLAAKIPSIRGKRRTMCGTPGYIAP
jgi:serine/threonine protein kinase